MKMPQIPFPPRIIVIDDNPAIHDDFRKILCPAVEESPADAMEAEIFGETDGLGYAPEEYDVATALQGQEGLEKIVAAIGAANPFSVAFVDGRMPPGWDGVETIQRIWKQVPDLQIVFCTAFSDYSWREVLARIGGNDNLVILKKPFDNIEVAQLARSLSQKWALRQQVQFQTRNLQTLVEARTLELRRSNLGFMMANDQLATAMSVKNDFIANITHELRTPVHGIISAGALLGGGSPSAEDRETLAIVQECSRTLLGHIDNLVAIAEKGSAAPLPSSTFSCRSVIDEVLERHRPAIADKGLFLRAVLDPVLAEPFKGHPGELGEALGQLVSNAAKFTAKGMVTVSSRIEVAPGKTRVLDVEVRDTGPGIPDDVQARLFTPFSAGDSSFMKQQAGLGLGLAVCLHLVCRMGGSLDIKGSEGHGTVAKIRVPEAA